MKQVTKKQHYIWRNYLAPWTSNNTNEGRIVCLRNNKIFTTSLMNVAHENYFYGVKELSPLEKELISKMFIENQQGVQRQINERWLKLYCSSFDTINEITFLRYFVLGGLNRDDIENNEVFKDWNVEIIEKLHEQIESSAIQFLSLLQENSLDFWKEELYRGEFSFYIANQYFRTKKIRERLISVFKIGKRNIEAFNEIHPENMWIPITLMLATSVGMHIFQGFSAILLQAPADCCFIVGDQPVVNTYMTYDILKAPEDVEFYYPISPHSALLLTKKQKEMNGQILSITPDEVYNYNNMEQKASNEFLFANDPSHLQKYILLE